MPDGVEKVGVEARAEGVAQFLRDMQKMERAYDSFTGRTGAGSAKVASSAQAATSAMGGLNATFAVVGGLTAVAAIGVNVLSKAFEFLLDIGKQVAAMLAQFAQEGLMLAGRFQEMEIAALAVGRSMGFTEDEIRGAIKEINNLNIRYDVAAKTVAQFARNQIDLANASDLVRIAQGAAVIAQEDSSEAMEHLVWAITTQNTRMLRTLGIMTDLAQAERDYAKAHGKKVEQLTESEQMQARVNAVIRDGASLLDVYTAAMESPTKALRSLSDRVIPELQAEMMQAFLPAWATVIKATTDFAETLRVAMQEGGALYPVLIKLGAAAALLADAFSAALGFITQNLPGILDLVYKYFRVWDMMLGNLLIALSPAKYTAEAAKIVLGIDSEFNQGFAQTAEDMFRWGAEIVAALAEGMVFAAAEAVRTVANVLDNLLSFWLGPGSPPRAVPDLDKWGAGAMREYLKGFTQADFSILKELSGIFQSALGKEGLAGVIDELMTAVDVGTVTDELFKRIVAASGPFGDELAKLARGELALAEATRRVNEANEKYETSQAKAGRLMAEYNDLLRQGATEQELAAKLAEVRTAEEERAAAAAEKQEAAKGLGDLEQQVALQRALVEQLTALFKLQEKGTTAAGKSAARAVKDIGKALDGLAEGVGPGGKWDIGNKIGAAIDAMKEQLKAKFKDIFKPLVDAWQSITEMLFAGYTVEGMPVAGLVPTVEKIVTDIQTLFDSLTFENLQARFEGLRNKVVAEGGLINFWTGWWVEHVKAWFGVDIPAEADKLIKKMGELRDVIGGPEESVLAAVTSLGVYLIEPFLPTLKEFWEFLTFKKGLIWALGEVEKIMWAIGEAVGTLVNYIKNAAKEWVNFIEKIDEGKAAALPFIGESPSPIELGIIGAAKAMRILTAEAAKFAQIGPGPTPAGAGLMSPVGAAAAQPSYNTMHQVTYSVNAPIGPNYISSGMDWAQFEMGVERVLKRATRRM